VATCGAEMLTLGAARSLFAALFLILVIIAFDTVQKNGRKLISKRGIDLTRVEFLLEKSGCKAERV
jgi:hypothetical protein